MKLRLLLLLLIAQTAHAQINWIKTNPGGGGSMGSVGAGPTGIMLVGSDLSGAYISRDDGQSWEIIGAAQGFTNTHVGAIGFDPVDEDIFYIGSEVGIFRTVDGGQNFDHVLTNGYVSYIKFSEANPNIGYAAYHPAYNSNNGVIYKTSDRGQSWSQISTDLPAGRRLLEIQINTYNPDKVYALSGNCRFACGPAELHRSTNGGLNWTRLAAGEGTIMDVALISQHPDTLYITTMNANCTAIYYWTDLVGNLLRSTDGGDSWTTVANRSGIIWPDRDNPDKLRLIDVREPYQWISSAGTWTSNDAGASWTKTGDVDNWDTYFTNTFRAYGKSADGLSKTLGEDMSDPNQILWITSQWAHTSDDGGTIFNNLITTEQDSGWWKSTGLDNVVMFDIDINASAPDTIYQAYADIGLWRSFDGGDSWQSCNAAAYSGGWSGTGGNVASVISDPADASVVWAVMQGSMYQNAFLVKNTFAGQKDQWNLSNGGLPNTPRMSGLTIDPSSPYGARTIFMIANGDVYKSSDDGANWSQVLNEGTLFYTEIDPNDPSKIYAGGSGGFYKSDDAGLSWSKTGLSEMEGSYDVFWSRYYRGVSDIFAMPGDTGVVYVTAFGPDKGLYKSTDFGDTWVKLRNDRYMRSVAKSGEMLVTGSSSAYYNGGYNAASLGVQYSFDEGLSWQDGNTGMSYPFANLVAFDGRDYERLFVGSPGSGFQRTNVGPVKCQNSLNPENLSSTIEATSLQFSWDPAQGSFGCQLVAGPLAGGYPYSRMFWGLDRTESESIPLASLSPGVYQAKVRCGCTLAPTLTLTDFSSPHYFLIPSAKASETTQQTQPTTSELGASFDVQYQNESLLISSPKEALLQLSVLNLQGQQVHGEVVQVAEGQLVSLPLKFTSGYYLVSISVDGLPVYSEKVFVK